MSLTDPAESPLRSVHTNNFPEVLTHLGIALVVTTYQASKVVILRADQGVLNTHFREYDQPMGLALSHARLAIGSGDRIIELWNVPAVAARLEPTGKHDACYLPRQAHITGDIDIHEMVYTSNNELWFVNTRFSCLCTLNAAYSFVPRWRPPFITAYDLGDRCHLNGLGLRDGQPRYVTALGATDTPGGWRANKAGGGILIDIQANQILLQGLSMPHSPRWYAGQLWFLESGKGELSRVDPGSGQVIPVVKLPGFTRGLDFYGSLAFVGLSQVRETAVFSGIPITEQLQERICGVWIVNIQTGAVVGFLRFEDGVQEIFAVSVLPVTRFPELLEWGDDLLQNSYTLPDEALREYVSVPGQLSATPISEPSQLPVSPQSAPGSSSSLLEAERLLNLGNEAYYQKQLVASAIYYQQCLVLKPDHWVACYNLGVVYLEQDQWERSRECLLRVVDADPNHAEAYNNLGILEQRQNRPLSAITYYEQAIALRYQFPDAHMNLGMALLQTGDLKRGFTEFEWRWQTNQFTPFNCPHPLWDGQECRGKTLLIHTEQGAGDTIQFARYLPIVAERCDRVILVCMPELYDLLSTVAGVNQVWLPGEIPLASFQTYAPLMSLPRILGTTLETIPAPIPYLKVPYPNTPVRLTSPQLKVGIVWAGSPTYRDDHRRSSSLSDWLPILEIPGVSFYSLQKGSKVEELNSFPLGKIQNLNPILKTFADTAGVIDQLDLVISVDTAVGHLAGALGKPVWLLVAYNSEWRWMLDRTDSPWYPTLRLLRQSQPGDWAGVFQQAAEQLKILVGFAR